MKSFSVWICCIHINALICRVQVVYRLVGCLVAKGLGKQRLTREIKGLSQRLNRRSSGLQSHCIKKIWKVEQFWVQEEALLTERPYCSSNGGSIIQVSLGKVPDYMKTSEFQEVRAWRESTWQLQTYDQQLAYSQVIVQTSLCGQQRCFVSCALAVRLRLEIIWAKAGAKVPWLLHVLVMYRQSKASAQRVRYCKRLYKKSSIVGYRTCRLIRIYIVHKRASQSHAGIDGNECANAMAKYQAT